MKKSAVSIGLLSFSLWGDDFALPNTGCPMAHCTPTLTDNVNATVPMTAKTEGHDSLAIGSGVGLGCSSNGAIVACTYNSTGGVGNLVVYDRYANRLWTSDLLNSTAGSPIISTAGEVIAADSQKVIRFGADGQVMWNTATPGNTPASPVLVNGAVVLATDNGPISAYRINDGAFLGAMYITGGGRDYSTTNVPTTIGNRMYVALRANGNHTFGRLSAIDIDPNSATPLKEAWYFSYTGPTGGSPLAIVDTIYFDGGAFSVGTPSRAYMYAVRDTGASGKLLWSRNVAAGIQASPALDPRGGLWIWTIYQTYIERLDSSSGADLQRIDISGLIAKSGYTFTPSSAMTIAQTATGSPVMLVGVTTSTIRSSYVIAIDLSSSSLIWKWPIPALPSGQDWTSAQFTILSFGGSPVVVFSTHNSGAYFIGE